MRGLQAEGVAGTAKHFPGHGDTSVDSHRELPVIEKDWKEFSAIELPPFEALARAEVPSIMTGHLAAPNLARHLGASTAEQDLPATLSRILTTNLLRERLGFEGVIVTDALEMHAITKHFGPEDAAVRAVLAGADVLLMPVDARATHASIASAVQSGILPVNRIWASLERIDRLKQQIEIIPSSIDPAKLEEVAEAHVGIAEEIARKAIEAQGVFDLSGAKIVILADERPEVMEKVKFFAQSIAGGSHGVEIMTTSEWPVRPLEFDANTIISAFHRARGFVGGDLAPRALPKLVRGIAQSLDGRGLAARGLILFGNPYLDREFQTPPGFVIKTFSESMPSIRAVIQMMNDAT